MNMQTYSKARVPLPHTHYLTTYDDPEIFLHGRFAGVSVTIAVPIDLAFKLFPEFLIEEEQDDAVSRGRVENDFVGYILRSHLSTFRTFIGKKPTLQAFLHRWTFRYGVIKGKETLQLHPKTNSRFSVAESHIVPIQNKHVYQPQDVYVQRFMYSCHLPSLRVKVKTKELDCYLHRTDSLDEDIFHHHMRDGFLQASGVSVYGMPKFEGFVAYRQDKPQHNGKDWFGVVGLLYEPFDGTPLSELSVPYSERPALREQLDRAHQNAGYYWRGKGPEDLLITNDGRLYLAPPERRWKKATYSSYGLEFEGTDRVESYLRDGPGSSLRRSPRVTTWPENTSISELQRNVHKLPRKVQVMVIEYLCHIDGNVMWMWGGKFYVFNDKMPFRLFYPEEWANHGLLKVFRESEPHFFEKNRFFTTVVRLPAFLDSSRHTAAMRFISISVHMRFWGGQGREWIAGIQKLAKHCPNLEKVQVHLFGYFGDTLIEKRLNEHPVLLELRRILGKKISDIKWEQPAFFSQYDEPSTIEILRKFWENKNLEVCLC